MSNAQVIKKTGNQPINSGDNPDDENNDKTLDPIPVLPKYSLTHHLIISILLTENVSAKSEQKLLWWNICDFATVVRNQ